MASRPITSKKEEMTLGNSLCTAAVGASAQKHPLTDVPPSAPGIEHKEWFPEHYSLQFPAGKQVAPLPPSTSVECISIITFGKSRSQGAGKWREEMG